MSASVTPLRRPRPDRAALQQAAKDAADALLALFELAVAQRGDEREARLLVRGVVDEALRDLGR